MAFLLQARAKAHFLVVLFLISVPREDVFPSCMYRTGWWQWYSWCLGPRRATGRGQPSSSLSTGFAENFIIFLFFLCLIYSLMSGPALCTTYCFCIKTELEDNTRRQDFTFYGVYQIPGTCGLARYVEIVTGNDVIIIQQCIELRRTGILIALHVYSIPLIVMYVYRQMYTPVRT